MAVDPPRPPLPPLNALRAFEAAARLGGFAAAAGELKVTPGAIAQQVRKLEDWLGMPVFQRTAHGVVLPEHGRRVAAQISRCLDELGGSVRALKTAAGPRPVHLAASPAIAQLWLRPQLAALTEALGGAAVSVTALEAAPDLDREMFDAALFFVEAGAATTGRRLVPVEADTITPVCAPSLAARLASPADLAGMPLLHDATWRRDWSRWLAAAGGPAWLAETGPAYSLYSMGVEAALAGEGVLIGHLPLLRAPLADGRLVRPFAHEVRLDRVLAILLPEPVGAEAARLAELLMGGAWRVARSE